MEKDLSMSSDQGRSLKQVRGRGGWLLTEGYTPRHWPPQMGGLSAPVGPGTGAHWEVSLKNVYRTDRQESELIKKPR